MLLFFFQVYVPSTAELLKRNIRRSWTISSKAIYANLKLAKTSSKNYSKIRRSMTISSLAILQNSNCQKIVIWKFADHGPFQVSQFLKFKIWQKVVILKSLDMDHFKEDNFTNSKYWHKLVIRKSSEHWPFQVWQIQNWQIVVIL